MKRILFCLLICISLCLAANPATADMDPISPFVYTITDDGAIITDYNYTMASSVKDVVIPAKLGGVNVVGLERNLSHKGVFQGCSTIETITMPDTILKLGGMDFSGCTSLREIHLSAGLTAIPTGCFQSCSSLASIVIPASVASISTINVFSGCTSLQQIFLPDRKVSFSPSSANPLPAGVTVVCHANSANTQNLSSFVDPLLPDWVLSWRANPGLLTIIGYEGTSTRPRVPKVASGITIYGMAPDALLGHALDTLTLPHDLASIEDDALLETAAAKVVIPAACTHIGAHAFAENPYLIYVYLPNGLTGIAPTAFDGCPHAVLVTQNADSAIEAFAEANGLGYLDLSAQQ